MIDDRPDQMIVWINGAFGVGKTTTAATIADRTDWRTFDPEHVGYLLAGNLRDLEFDDFQDLPPWRALVPAVAAEIHRYTSPTALMAVQTVFVEQYWNDLVAGFRRFDLAVFHVVLDCQESELRRRIESDEVEDQARDWRLDHVDRFAAARAWLLGAADTVIDTTDLATEAVADRIIDAVGGTEALRPRTL